MQSNLVLKKNDDIYTVSRLNSEVRFLLEDTYALIWVEGEISNFSAPNSGHWYFSLKDSTAQVSCAMFRSSQRKLTFTPKDGMHVLLKARVSLYENSGRFQLIAEDMEERGEGKLQRAFEALKKKLEATGLFDTARKKPLPAFPKQIGVITSATGAAIRDILNVLRRRFACLPVIIYPTLVQGTTAAPAIVKALEIANKRNECDVLILARGGGSLEDLWPFNEEAVANAIFNSQIPIITGVGHEVDFTIADFVADIRAPTPSAAAEMATPDSAELLASFTQYQFNVVKQMNNKLAQLKNELAWTHKHLSQQHPKRRLNEKMQHLDFCEVTLNQLLTKQLNNRQNKLKDLIVDLYQVNPISPIKNFGNQLQLSAQKLNHLIVSEINQRQHSLSHSAAKLNALSPLGILNRGYAIASTETQKIVRNANQVSKGDAIKIKLFAGELECKVEKVVA